MAQTNENALLKPDWVSSKIAFHRGEDFGLPQFLVRHHGEDIGLPQFLVRHYGENIGLPQSLAGI